MLNIFIEERCEKIPEAGCWIWKGALSAGYGSFRSKRTEPTKSAHRASYENAYGPIPKEMHVLHRCDVRACCNPHHLFLGTNADNIADSVAKGRRKGIKGMRGKVPCVKIYKNKMGPKRFLSSEQELIVFEMTKRGYSQRALAKHFKVSDTTIHNTLKRLLKCYPSA